MTEDKSLTKSEIKSFQKIAAKNYGVKLTDRQSLEQGLSLVSLFEFLIKRQVKKSAYRRKPEKFNLDIPKFNDTPPVFLKKPDYPGQRLMYPSASR